MPSENSIPNTAPPPPPPPPEIDTSAPKKSSFILPVTMVILLVIVAAGTYYFYRSSLPATQTSVTTQVVPTLAPPSPTVIPDVSSSTDSATIEKELDATDVNSLDSEFKALDSSASGL